MDHVLVVGLNPRQDLATDLQLQRHGNDRKLSVSASWSSALSAATIRISLSFWSFFLVLSCLYLFRFFACAVCRINVLPPKTAHVSFLLLSARVLVLSFAPSPVPPSLSLLLFSSSRLSLVFSPALSQGLTRLSAVVVFMGSLPRLSPFPSSLVPSAHST